MIRAFTFLLLLLSSNVYASGSSVRGFLLDGMRCAHAQRFVAKQGAVVFHYGNGQFDRVVNDPRFCDRDQTLRPFSFDLIDSMECHVGYVCQGTN